MLVLTLKEKGVKVMKSKIIFKGKLIYHLVMMMSLLILVGCSAGGGAETNGTSTNPNQSQATYLSSSRHECLNVPNCVSVEKDTMSVKKSSSLIAVQCPDSAPYFWNWDAEHQADISIALQETSSDKTALLLINKRNEGTISNFKIYLGCSPAPVQRTIRFTHMSVGESAY